MTDKQNPSWQIKLLYDGECPLCLREVRFLEQKDGGRGLVAFVDIADANYSSEDNGGIDYIYQVTCNNRLHSSSRVRCKSQARF